MRRRLSDEEREIRSGRGIPFRRWWPIPAMIFAVFLISSHSLWFDSLLFERCFGHSLDGGGRGAGTVMAIVAIPCSPFLLAGSSIEKLLFAMLWLPLPFAILNGRWWLRHKAYWDRVRRREAERRAEKRAVRARKQAGEDRGDARAGE